ncbi:CpaF family protein [Thioalkalivibrio sp. K90mix]|uniref:CpaF family protein n=1 Tax=Thioalkalivibrio sp. (strain K90mix) TaxID=396595 RepID=UPI001FCB298B|nr:ATPase, T2SS/T4P/T4SS family [Thioalkalivibrio sp. K90mix]
MLRKHLKPIAEHLDDPEVQEVMVNSPSSVWVEKAGQVQQVESKLSDDAVRAAIVLMGRLDRKDVNENSADAIIDTQIEGMRVAAALAPIAQDGHSICIRKHRKVRFSTEDYAEQLAAFHNGEAAEVKLDEREPEPPRVSGEGLSDWVQWLIRASKNFLVSGGTSSGKTALLNALLQHIPEQDRVMVLEDVPELDIGVPNCVRVQTNHQIGIGMQNLLKLALRYRPDRIVIGEIRGAEAFDLLQAMNTGHDGCCCSLHANSASQALARLETLVLTADVGWPMEAIRAQIGNTIDYVIQMSRTQGRRHLAEIARVDGYHDGEYRLTPVFYFNPAESEGPG